MFRDIDSSSLTDARGYLSLEGPTLGLINANQAEDTPLFDSVTSLLRTFYLSVDNMVRMLSAQLTCFPWFIHHGWWITRIKP